MKGLRLNLKPINKHPEQQFSNSHSQSKDHLSHRSEKSLEQIEASSQSIGNYNEEYSFNHI